MNKEILPPQWREQRRRERHIRHKDTPRERERHGHSAQTTTWYTYCRRSRSKERQAASERRIKRQTEQSLGSPSVKTAAAGNTYRECTRGKDADIETHRLPEMRRTSGVSASQDSARLSGHTRKDDCTESASTPMQARSRQGEVRDACPSGERKAGDRTQRDLRRLV